MKAYPVDQIDTASSVKEQNPKRANAASGADGAGLRETSPRSASSGTGRPAAPDATSTSASVTSRSPSGRPWVEEVERLDPPTQPVLLTPAICALLGEPVLLPGECREAYWRLLEDIALSVHPKNALEWLHVRDIADGVFEEQRLKAIKATTLAGAIGACLESELRTVYRASEKDPERARRRAKLQAAAALSGRPGALALAEKALAKPIEWSQRAGEAMRSFRDNALFLKSCDPLEVIERLLAATNARRQRSTRALHDYRLIRARTYRQEYVFPTRKH